MQRLFSSTPVFVTAVALLAGTSAFALQPALAQSIQPFLQHFATVSCSLSTACQTYANASTGPGAKSTSAKGSGLLGATTFASTQLSNGKAGVLGQDLSTSGAYDTGVSGTSVKGIGVLGTTAATNAPPYTYPLAGVVGISSASQNGVGVYGTSPTGPGVFGSSTSSKGPGVLGTSTANDGVDAESSSATHWALTGTNSGGGPLLSLTNGGVSSVNVDNGGNMNMSGGLTVATSGTSQVVVDKNGNLTMGGNVSIGGNENVTGKLTVGGGCTGCAVGQKVVRAYVSRVSEPTLEDFGEAQLGNGYAHVRLEGTYASAIAQRPNYLVFVTPEGDNHGLYVTNKSLEGFDVRETQGGRSSVAFSYRIVAQPFGAGAPRLPIVNRSEGRAK